MARRRTPAADRLAGLTAVREWVGLYEGGYATVAELHKSGGNAETADVPADILAGYALLLELEREAAFDVARLDIARRLRADNPEAKEATIQRVVRKHLRENPALVDRYL